MTGGRRRVRPLAVVVLVVLVVVFVGLTLIARRVVENDARHLLEKQTGEVSALLTNSFSGVDASLRSLTAVADAGDPTARAFVQSAQPLVVGQTRAVLLVRLEGGLVRRVAIVGDGVPAGPLGGDRAALVRRAVAEPGLVTGVVVDGPRRRIGLARGSWPAREGWIVYQESAIDPSSQDQPTTGRPFGELDVAVYASQRADADRLVFASSTDVPTEGAGHVATAVVPVGVDKWLVVARSPRPLVGGFATGMPWMLLAVGLLLAALASSVVEIMGRRGDYALSLVADRTEALRSTVAELERAQDELMRRAFTDSLTGLANRAVLFDRLRNALGRARRGAPPPIVAFLDVDRFKWVNDSLGHDAGDELLVTIAARLAGWVRPGDTAARFGGDEFVVLCDGVGAEEALRIAERLQAAVSQPIQFRGREIQATVSIGLTVCEPDDPRSADELVRDADLAMYRAKELGRNRIEVFDQRLRGAALLRMEQESALRSALEMDEFVVHYQPVVDIAGAVVVGVEALVRWQTPSGELVLPDDFIPLAEDTGLIEPLGSWALGLACAQVAEWNRRRQAAGHRPLRLSVNVSSRQLAGTDLGGFVEATLEASGLSPTHLCLEITESTLMDSAGARAALDQLKALGATIVVDDFGTGYSSLIYLRNFPVDELKVDKSFVAGLGTDHEDTAIVDGVISLAKALGLRTVAEGVETADQLAHLASIGCELAQGYLWTPALPGDRFAEWLEQFEAAADVMARRPPAAAWR